MDEHKAVPDSRGFCKTCGRAVMVDENSQPTTMAELLDWKHVYSEKPGNIPHAARLLTQFKVEERTNEPKTFIGTDKVLGWCNCGEVTGWLNLHQDLSTVHQFFEKHNGPAEEIGIRMYYYLGELAGYRIDPREQGLYLVHTCGWEKEISHIADRLLPSIVLEVLGNKHICEVKE